MSAICSATSCSFYDAVGDVEEEVLRELLPPQKPGAAPGEDQQLIGMDAYQANAGIKTSCGGLLPRLTKQSRDIGRGLIRDPKLCSLHAS